jgi:photosystem II stability/assembly factor-like uncharacterized protein
LQKRAVLSVLFLLTPLARPALAGVDQWTRVGPDGGNVLILAAAPSHPSTVYAGLSLGGVFRSQDSGATWSFAGDGLIPREPVNALVVDARRPGVLWSGTGDGLYRSMNSGGTWVLANRGGVEALVQNPSSGMLYAGAQIGPMLRSVDGGLSWQPLAGSPKETLHLAIDPVQTKILYAGNATGLFKSANGGASWAPIAGGLPAGRIDALAVDPRSRAIYAAVTGAAPGQNVFRSDDEGGHWTPAGDERLDDVHVLAVDPGRKGAVWAVSAGKVFRSPDQGRTWTEADAGLPGAGASTVFPGAAALLAGTGFGVYRSAGQGASWSLSSQGLEAATIFALALDPLRPSRLYAATPEIFRTATGGGQWAPLPGAPSLFDVTGPLAADPHHPGTAYVGLYGGIAKTVDAGNTWSSAANLTCLLPRSIAVDPLDSSVVYVAGTPGSALCDSPPSSCTSYRSDDAGQHWTCTQIGQFLAPDPLQPSRVYALAGLNVEVSTDRGGSWSLLTPGVNFYVLVPDPQRPGTIWAGGPDGPFRSDDSGHTWNLADEGVPQSAQVTVVVLDPVDKDILYVATLQNGVFRSADGGLTWDALGTGLEGLTVRFLALDPRTRTTLYAGTDEAGVMKIRQSGE